MKKKTRADYYKENPESYAKKKKYDSKLEKRADLTKKRVELNAYNKKNKKTGNGDGLDAIHKGKKIVGYAKASANRGDTNDSAGDKRARGKKKMIVQKKSPVKLKKK
jgi:hypothetical protein